MNPDPEEVGKRLKLLRIVLGFHHQNAMTRFLGESVITPQNWNNWERARHVPNIAQARHIAMKCRVTSDWIYWDDTAGLPLNMAQRLAEAENEAPGAAKRGRAS